MSYVARKSNHIQEDIKRNWSSWNFGLEGISCTEDQLEQYKTQAIEEDKPLWISGFELWGDEIENSTYGELYPGYWVLVDTVNARHGLSAIDLSASSLEEAIAEADSRSDYFGEGISFNSEYATLVYSNDKDGIHVFYIED